MNISALESILVMFHRQNHFPKQCIPFTTGKMGQLCRGDGAGQCPSAGNQAVWCSLYVLHAIC